MSVVQRLAAIEEQGLGEAQKGTLVARLSAAEIAVLGAKQENQRPVQRLEALEYALGIGEPKDSTPIGGIAGGDSGKQELELPKTKTFHAFASRKCTCHPH